MQQALLLQQLRTTLGIHAESAWQHKLNLLRAKGEGQFADGLQMLMAVVEKSYAHFERQLNSQALRADGLQEQLQSLEKDLQQTWRSLANSDASMPDDVGQLVVSIKQLMLQNEAEHGALYASEARNRRLLEGLREIVFQSNTRGHLTYLNPSWTDITDFSVEEGLGQRALSFVHPEDRKRCEPMIKSLFSREHESMRMHVRCVTKDGDYRWLEVSVRRLENNQGRMLGVSGSAVDITEQKLAQDRLRDSEERLNQALVATNSHLWDWDVAQPEPYIAPQWLRNLGYGADELRNLPWQQQLHPDDWPRWQQHLKEHLKRQRSELDIELRFATKNGGWRHASLRGKVVLWRARRAVRMAGMLLDVTARKQAEEAASEQRELTEQILDQLPISVFLKDREGRFLRINRQFQLLSNIPREQILGKTVFDFSSQGWAEVSQSDDELAWQTRQLVTTERRMRSVEPPLDMQLNRIVIDIAPGQSYLLGFSIDITEQRAVRDALQQALESAQAASQAKSEFLANMSHEIRTPMNGILGMTELALETTLTRDQREYMTMVKSSGDSLLVIINDILDFSKIEAGKLDIAEEPFDLKKLVTETAKSMSLRAHEKDLELRCDLPSNLPNSVRGDPGRLRQVLVNLLGNAIKFTERGEVVLSLAVVIGSDGKQEIEFTVQDSGIGIPKEKQALIFEAFSQVDGSTTRQYGGTGLGLTICKRLVGLMHGQIEVQSEIGVGSSFRFTLPLARVGEHNQLLPMEQLRGMTALVVDHDSANRRSAADILTDASLVVFECASGSSALIWLASQPRPAFVMLAHSNGQDGLAIAQQVLRLANPPLVVLQVANESDVVRAEQIGVDLVLQRPVPAPNLVASVRAMLGNDQEFLAPHAHMPAHVNDGARLDILLAEDNLVNQRLALRLFERLGHRVTVVDNGLAVVRRATQEQFDLIFMDLQMPGMDGLSATMQIREWERNHAEDNCHIPIIAMTAHAMQGDRERCLEAGMDDYLSKPIHSARLRQMLAQYHPIGQQVALDQVLQWRTALLRLDGEADLLLELGTIFLADGPALLLRLQEALLRGEMTEVAAQVHSLRGVLVNFGAHLAIAQTDRLTHGLHSGEDIETLLSITDELEVNLYDVYAALNEMIEGGAKLLLAMAQR